MSSTPSRSGLRHADRLRDDSGFTLIELLVVVVILPLLMGAVAEAFVVAYRHNAANSNRISDTANVQLTQSFFVRDVQGASYISTRPNSLFSSYSASSPQVCTPSAAVSAANGHVSSGSTSITTTTAFFTPAMNGLAVSDSLGDISAGTTLTYVSSTSATLSQAATGTSSADNFSSGLLLALYHPAQGSGSALDVAYWAEGSGTSSEVDRYSCTLNSTTYASNSAVKVAVASPPPASGLGVGQTSETITASAEIDPSQFSSAAQNGWTTVGAFTTALGYTSPTLTVGSTAGFTSGSLTLVSPSGSQQLTGCTVASSTTFTGCSAPSGTVPNGTAVTQSSISSVQLTVAQPASSYTYNLAAAPRVTTPQTFSGVSNPNLLTLGIHGISPVNGGGGDKCPDGITANICIGGSTASPGTAVVDSGGIVYCNGAGVHNYLHFQDNSGSVETTAPSSSSSCNNVSVTGSVPSVPDPLLGKLPNNGCFPASLVSTAAGGSASVGGLTLNPATVGGRAVPGVYDSSHPLNGTLEPGIYVLEGGVGTVSMATYSLTDTYFQGDKNAGVLFFIPGPSSAYSSSQGCFTDSTYGASTALSGTVSGVVPFDSTQAAASFSGNTTLGGVWVWQDAFNTNDVTLTGFSAPATGSSETGGLLYAPAADYTPPSPAASLSTGSMIIAGTSDNGSHLSLCLNWTYTATC